MATKKRKRLGLADAVQPRSARGKAAPKSGPYVPNATQVPSRHDKKMVSFWLNRAADRQARMLCIQDDITMQEFLERAIDDQFVARGIDRLASAWRDQESGTAKAAAAAGE